jgi:hypothetical protein
MLYRQVTRGFRYNCQGRQTPCTSTIPNWPSDPGYRWD